jgi:hypothetical protein
LVGVVEEVHAQIITRRLQIQSSSGLRTALGSRLSTWV